MSEQVHIISLGAGVQSSAMALMAACGEISPMPECAVFADTQQEPASVYRWLDWLEKQLPFPVHRVTGGNLAWLSLMPITSGKTGKTYLGHSLPVYIVNKDGSKGNMFRQCTDKMKLTPLRKEIDRLRDDRPAIVWIGISSDEALRMKESQRVGVTHIWPLVERRISRAGCMSWMQAKGYPKPPRSACVQCPYHSNAEWRRLKTEEPEEFNRAIRYESDLQSAFKAWTRLEGTPFLHASRKPLSEVDFGGKEQSELFTNECEGMCGV